MPRRGEFWWVRLDPATGPEIGKTLAVSHFIHQHRERQRRTVVVVPLSSSPRPSPPLPIPVQCAGRTVVAVTDQIRAVSKDRLGERLGEASRADMEAIEAGVRRILELP